jgi:hypothetical protein
VIRKRAESVDESLIMSDQQDSSIKGLKDLSEITPALNSVGLINKEPPELELKGAPSFEKSFDDLDYLEYSLVSLPSKKLVTLVRHQGAPTVGTELCVALDDHEIAQTIVEVLGKLSLSIQDLSWIHPDYEPEIKGHFA